MEIDATVIDHRQRVSLMGIQSHTSRIVETQQKQVSIIIKVSVVKKMASTAPVLGKVSKTSLRIAVVDVVVFVAVVAACFVNWLFLYSNGNAKLHPKLYLAFCCAVCSIQHFRERKEGKKR